MKQRIITQTYAVYCLSFSLALLGMCASMVDANILVVTNFMFNVQIATKTQHL